MSTAIALFSSGLDCTTGVALALSEGIQVRLALCIDYGQRAAQAEWQQAQKLCKHFDVPLRKLDLPWLGAITHSALAQQSTQKVPEVGIHQLDQVMTVTLASAAQVWVPNRNGLFVNIAAAFADSAGDTLILTGFNAEEAATFPDNTPQFTEAISRSLAFSTQVQVRVYSPVQHLNKIEIVHDAIRLGVPLDALWSCYHEGPTHCGRCESCNRLKRALQATRQNQVFQTLFGAAHA